MNLIALKVDNEEGASLENEWAFFPFAGQQVGLCVVLTFIEESLVGYMLLLLWNTFKECLFFADLLNCSRVRFLRGFLLNLGVEGHKKNITE